MKAQLREDVVAYLDTMNAIRLPDGLSLEDLRAGVRMNVAAQDLPRGEIARVDDLTIAGGAGQPMRVRLYADHRSGAAAPVMLFFHGGGWTVCDLDTHDALCAEIARVSGLTVVSVDYRLAPEHPFPAAFDDCAAAMRWAATSPVELGHPASGIVLAGDSAGGTLAAGCAQLLDPACPVLVQWLIYAAVDMTATGGSADEYADGFILTTTMMEGYRAGYLVRPGDRVDPRASPIRYEQVERLPRALIFSCECDVLRDQGRAYAASLVRHGVSVRYREGRGQVHGSFIQRRSLPSAQDDLLGCLNDLASLVAEAAGDNCRVR